MLTSSRLFSIFYTFIYDFPTPPRIANRNNAAPHSDIVSIFAYDALYAGKYLSCECN